MKASGTCVIGTVGFLARITQYVNTGTLQDVAREVLVLRQVGELPVHEGCIDLDRRTTAVGGLEGDLLQHPFHDGVQSPRADVLGALVDRPGDRGNPADTVRCDRMVTDSVAAMPRTARSRHPAQRIARDPRHQRVELDANRPAYNRGSVETLMREGAEAMNHGGADHPCQC